MRKQRYKTSVYRTIYVLQDTTELQLPLATFDSIYELAKYCNTTPSNIYSAICNAKKRNNRCKFDIVRYTFEQWREFDLDESEENNENKKTI